MISCEMKVSAHQAPASVNLLGAFSLQCTGAEQSTLPIKGQALVAFLAIQQGLPVARDVVAELFWPDRGDKQARNSLKQELYVLRRNGFGGCDIIVTRESGICIPPELIACDLHRLRAAIRSSESVSWRVIADLYRGPLLHGFPPVSPEFDDLVARIRHTLEADVLEALGRLADVAAADEDIKQALAIADRMLAIDPLREDTHRRLIEFYTRAGRRTDALRIYSDARTLLRQELDVAPAAATETLIARIRADAPTFPARAEVPAGPADGGPPRLAVLPLRQFLDRPLPSHISDGITADIIGQLAGLRELTVISHGSTFDLRDPAIDTREVGRKLNVRYLVLTRIHAAGDRLRLTTELTEAETGAVFPPFYDHADAGLSFDHQDRIVSRLVNKLVPQLRETELRRIRGKRPNVLSVYEKTLLSREHITLLNRDAFEEARRLLNEVIQEDPGYGEAYALAAEWHGAMIGERWSRDRASDIAAAEQLTQTALHYDSGNVRALLSYGSRRSNSYRDHAGAMRMFRQALELAPSSATAWALSGLCSAFAGDAAEAVGHVVHALELSPNDREAYKFHHALCVAHYTGGDYEQAVEWGRQALVNTSIWRGTRGFTAAALVAIGRLHEARGIISEMQAASPGRRLRDVVNDLAYRDPERRQRYGEHLAAAGYPE
jgi:DNA-binding SARP family transcriptional activator/TolB-like protein/Tfp pilus assembly protein PilF